MYETVQGGAFLDHRMTTIAQSAREAAIPLAALPGKARDEALLCMADSLKRHGDAIEKANLLDMEAAQRDGLAEPLLKRLRFDPAKNAQAREGLVALAALPDPIGHTQLARELSPGLNLYRVSCPIGVIGVIFESRPDALVQIASLCLKSGNAVLMKGGREALHTNRALYAALVEATESLGLPAHWLSLLETRDDVAAMLKMDEAIDLIIPRGSNDFVRYIMDNSRIPVLGHADGICHVYVDKGADIQMAVDIAVDSKAQYVSVCNAAETLLVHKDIAKDYLPAMAAAMKEEGVALRGCPETRKIISVEAATEEDWDTEYLDYMLSVAVVESLKAAIAHINRHGSGHTDVIVTEDEQAACAFMTLVDSAGVYQNCSSRFADGFRYGFGAEVGVATGKIHARGPMGIEGLCTYKYKLFGHGHTLASFDRGERAHTHRDIDMENPCS